MSSRSSRFLNLERARDEKSRPEGQVRLENGGRFESVAGPGGEPTDTGTVPEAHVERFKLHGQTPLALDASPTEGQRFSRCVHCQTENGRFTQVCLTCGADLQTPEQRTADEERWRAREQADAQTREQMRSAARSDAPLQAPPATDGRQPLFTPSLGVGLLRRLPHPLARWMTLAWAVGLPLLLVRFGGKPARLIGLYLCVFIGALFVPTRLWTRGRHEE